HSRGKKSISLDIDSPKGREVFLDMAKKLDVVTNNWRPGTAEKRGVDFKSLSRVNPGIICCGITGYGTKGPYRDRASWDTIAAAHTGILSISGESEAPPTLVGGAIMDVSTSTWAAMGIIAALHERHRTGKGQQVDTSLFEVGLSLLIYFPTIFGASGIVPKPPGQVVTQIPLGGLFPTRDGYIASGPLGNRQWLPFCRALGLEDKADDPRFVSEELRSENKELLLSIVREASRKRTSVELVDALVKEGVAASAVNDIAEALADPQTSALGAVVTVEGAEGKPVQAVRSPINFSQHPSPTYDPVPRIGQDTEDLLTDILGYSRDKIEELKAAKAI
ncbi:MAG: CaiB/BaiF CoA-transferase family protein, partial [Dehalococcoidia bacterium]|nr:CaiB/BaiF CoA-transferase family protein [Dehalococcoidia bacterium]